MLSAGLGIHYPLLSQSELTLPTLSHILESDRYNPSISMEEEGWFLGLPSVAYNAFHTGPGYRELIEEKESGPILQIKNLVDQLAGENELITDGRFQTFKIKRRMKNWTFGLEHEIVFHAQVLYPDELVRLYVEGNQPWIGQTVDIAPEATIFSYNNFALPLAYHGKNFSVGIRPRLLLGNQFGRTPQVEASLHTGEDFYQLTLTTNYVFENVGIIDFEDANLLNYRLEDLRQWNLFSNHRGFGLDLGLQFAVSDQAKFALSVSDIGYLQWQDVKQYASRRTTVYSGVEVLDLFEIGQIDLEEALDSLDAIFDVETNEDAVRFDLPVKWHVHFSYQLNEMWQLSTSFTYQGQLLQPWNIGVVVTGEVRPNWFVGSSITNRYGDLGVGLHSTLSWGSVTGFLVSDQLLRGVNPLQANHLNLRAGLNIRL